MNTFPEIFKIEIGKYADVFVKYLVHNFSGFFDALKQGILWFVVNIELILQWVPWWLVIGVIFLLGWKIKKLSSGIAYAVMLVCIGSFGLWGLMMSTLAIVLTSVVISLLVGIPIGILMAYKDKVEVVMKPILDGMQTMPSFVYLIPAVILFGMGKVPGVFATTIYAIAPAIRLTNLAIRGVSREMIEAAESFGASSMQILLKVEIP